MRSQQFIKNPKASIYFYNKGRFKYEGIMLTGTNGSLAKFTAINGRYYCDLKTESLIGAKDLQITVIKGLEAKM